MRKSLFALAPVVVLLAGTGLAQAANNTQITITASVVAATCDVSVSSSSLDLGNYTKTAFKAVATPINESLKSFSVGLNNCDAPEAAGDTANLIISGQTLAGSSNIFNSTGTNTGVMLSLVDKSTEYLTNGQKLLVSTAGETPAAGDFNAKSLKLQAGLASNSTTPDIGGVSAPVLFSFAYN